MKFREDYYFLSNMYPCPVNVNINGKKLTFSCAEAAFQAFKCPEEAERFMGIDGFAAKKMGRKITLRKDWESVKLSVMRDVVKAKFGQNPGLMVKLKSVTGEIVEDNTWNDRFWGRCQGTGQNWLGKLLMEIRDGAQ